MLDKDVIIVGGGPCGLAAALSLMEKGFNPLVIEKGNIVNTIFQYPTHQTFFSTSEKLEIGDVAFVIEQRKPTRNQALSYYREVVKRKKINFHSYEKVLEIRKEDQMFYLPTIKKDGTKAMYKAPYVILATGYYDNPNKMDIPGEELDKVFHYFKEAHPFFQKNVAVIGGKNSAIDAALELQKAGANVTVFYKGKEYSSSIKPWILPEFESLVRHGFIQMEFEANVLEISQHELLVDRKGERKTIPNDFVFAMTGYRPDHSFLQKMGIIIDTPTGRPLYNPETMETNVTGAFIAGVIAAGNNANEIFIENGRFHGKRIAEELEKRKSI